ncbi:Carbamate kinase 1 [bioreactor metagenome]|uniref:Carbamate kinase 1 n=1 Tax=bioreactor metagenome TaxID=1076179 RepID=A0A645FJY0_9ZZZZ
MAEKLEKEQGFIMKEDAGRGYRRVVASPKPIDVIEKEMIKELVEDGKVVISCGGGGIPVIREDEMVKGVAAVIDKDFAAEKLAEILEADCLLILTAVDRVCVNFNKPDQKELAEINIEEVNRYIEEGQFAPGSMLPKVEACKKFVMHDGSKIAMIASLSKAKEALKGLSGTKIVR